MDQDLEKSEILEVLGFAKDSTSAEQIKDYKQQVCVERFKLFINALVGTLSQTPQKKLDPSNYEDIVRMLMGDQAYLLFVFDKLIMQVSGDSRYSINQLLNNQPLFCTDLEKSARAQDERRVPEEPSAVHQVQQGSGRPATERAPLLDTILASNAVSCRQQAYSI